MGSPKSYGYIPGHRAPTGQEPTPCHGLARKVKGAEAHRHDRSKKSTFVLSSPRLKNEECVCVCVCVCVCKSIRVCLCLCVCLCIFLCVQAHMYVHVWKPETIDSYFSFITYVNTINFSLMCEHTEIGVFIFKSQVPGSQH